MTDSHEWPNGLSEEVAVIDTSINDLERLYDVSFDSDIDDLDYFSYHIFNIDNKHYALMRYNNAPMPGVTLIIEKQDNQDMERCVDEALRELRLSNRRILWRRQ